MKPHFGSDFFRENRRRLLNELGSGALVIVAAHGEMQRIGDVAYRFQQEPNFWYLSGIDTPDWWLIIDGSQNRSWLVHPDLDDVRRVFDGRLEADVAVAASGVNAVIDRTEARRLFGTFQRTHSVAYTVLPQMWSARHGFYPNPAPRELKSELRGFTIRDCRAELARLRTIKQPLEIAALQRAIEITAAAIKAVLAQSKQLSHEYEVAALISYECRRRGAIDAWEPIVAADYNASTIHHQADASSFTRKNWLLLDIGAQWEHYCADISRTFPLSRTITQRRRAIYEALERVHNAALKLCVVGQSIADYQTAIEAMMGRELAALGLIASGDNNAVRQWFPHAISHGLGLDAHDSLGRTTHFAAGMVVTIEPGVYIPQEQFGARIENDILITDGGPKNLSSAVPIKLDKLLALIA